MSDFHRNVGQNLTLRNDVFDFSARLCKSDTSIWISVTGVEVLRLRSG